MEKILFIGANRLGDAVLSTGLLAALAARKPMPQITVACGQPAVEIFAACPAVVRVIPLIKRPMAGHWRDLWRQVALMRWDLVVDLRDSLVSRLLLAKKVARWRPTAGEREAGRHKVEQNAAVLGLNPPPAPHLWFPPAILAEAEALLPAGAPALVLAPGATARHKEWPADRFAETAKTLLDGPLQGWRLVLMGAPDERRQTEAVLSACAKYQPIDLTGRTRPLLAGAVLSRAGLLIGNDNGLMHLGAAAGLKVIGLFGPTPVEPYRPWGGHVVQSRVAYADLRARMQDAGPDAPGLMDGVMVADVVAAAIEYVK